MDTAIGLLISEPLHLFVLGVVHEPASALLPFVLNILSPRPRGSATGWPPAVPAHQ